MKFDRIWEKGPLHISRIFILKCLYLWNHSNYELQTWHECSAIILLEISSPPISGMGEVRGHVDHNMQKSPLYFYASLWRLTTRDKGLSAASNVKYKAQTASKWSEKPGGLEALEWWQFEKWLKKSCFAQVPFLMSYYKWLMIVPQFWYRNCDLLYVHLYACNDDKGIHINQVLAQKGVVSKKTFSPVTFEPSFQPGWLNSQMYYFSIFAGDIVFP